MCVCVGDDGQECSNADSLCSTKNDERDGRRGSEAKKWEKQTGGTQSPEPAQIKTEHHRFLGCGPIMKQGNMRAATTDTIWVNNVVKMTPW